MYLLKIVIIIKRLIYFICTKNDNSVIIYPQIFSSITSNPAVNENARIISGSIAGSRLYKYRSGRYNKRVRICNGIALLFVLAYIIIKDTSLYNNSTVVIGLDIVQGFAVGMLLVDNDL